MILAFDFYGDPLLPVHMRVTGECLGLRGAEWRLALVRRTHVEIILQLMPSLNLLLVVSW